MSLWKKKELEGWDPAVEATPLMQAIDKETVMREIGRVIILYDCHLPILLI